MIGGARLRPCRELPRLDRIVLRVRDSAAMRRLRGLGCAFEREQPEIALLQSRAGATLVDIAGKRARQDGAAPVAATQNIDLGCAPRVLGRSGGPPRNSSWHRFQPWRRVVAPHEMRSWIIDESAPLPALDWRAGGRHVPEGLYHSVLDFNIL